MVLLQLLLQQTRIAWAYEIPEAGHLNDDFAAGTPADDPAVQDTVVEDKVDLPEEGAFQDDVSLKSVPTSLLPIQLDVLINGYQVDLIAGFKELADGSLASTRDELMQIGINPPGRGASDQEIALNIIPSLKYYFDREKHTIDIHLDDIARVRKLIEVTPKKEFIEPHSDIGFVLNHTSFATAEMNTSAAAARFTGLASTLDARAFSNFGVLQQTGTLQYRDDSEFEAIRLNSNWSYSSHTRAETYTIGDIVSSSLNWTRPVRMGGAQLKRNLGLRADLITKPLPSLEGSAAVPSTLDLFINGHKTYTKEVEPGPFEVTRFPIVTNQGTARLVLTDTTGQKTITETPFYTSNQLLAKGLFDYSVELGAARRSFGIESFDYDDTVLGLASARYGLNNSITLEAHAEAGLDLVQGGLGAVVQAGGFGTFNAAVAASTFEGETGFLAYGSWDWSMGNLLIHAASTRRFGDYTDLAGVTEVAEIDDKIDLLPRAVDQLTLAYGWPTIETNAAVNLVHIEPEEDERAVLLDVGISKSIRSEITISANAYANLLSEDDYGMTLGVSMPLGKQRDKSLFTEVGYNSDTGVTGTAVVAKPLGADQGSIGWRVAAAQQSDQVTNAGASYRAKQAVLSASIDQSGNKMRGRVSAEGAVVATRSGVFLANPVHDAFAVVDVGLPDISVAYENRFAGKTGKNGKLLIPSVRSYRPTTVSIDTTTLPLEAQLTESERQIAPRGKSGVSVDFQTNSDTQSAIVILKDKNGEDVAPGTLISVTGQAEPFAMGYDGQVYLTGLGANNTVSADLDGTTCSVTFDFSQSQEAQPVVGPLTCL